MSERVIRQLLQDAGRDIEAMGAVEVKTAAAQAPAQRETLRSPETYLGYWRIDRLVSPGGALRDKVKTYAPAPLSLNQWSFTGDWTVARQSARAEKAGGRISYRFHARDLHLVLKGTSDAPVRFRVLLDGKAPGADAGADIDASGNDWIDGERLYQLIRQKGAVRERTFTIEFLDPGAEAVAFTFGWPVSFGQSELGKEANVRIPLIIAGVLAFSSAASAQEQPLQSPIQALAQDAREYSSRHGVSLEVALARLRAQEESVAATDRLQEVYKDRLAGISIEHSPEMRMVVLLTGAQPVPDQVIAAGGLNVPVVFRTGFRATREQVIAAIEKHQAGIRSLLRTPPGLGHDPKTGDLVLLVNSRDVTPFGSNEAMAAHFAELTGVPVRVRILDRVDANASIEGGARLEGVDPANGKRYACTTGFVVTDGSRTGVVTAAHCPDTLTYLDPHGGEVPLTFIGQWGWAYRDVQVHVGGDSKRPIFYADTPKTAPRTLASWRNRPSTRAGDFVCHRGERTGYSCSEVDLVDYAPPGDLCGGPCTPTWVTVAGPSCKSGDSGGPIFLGNKAFGIVKGGNYRKDGTCNFYYYMSTDYLPDNWRLLY